MDQFLEIPKFLLDIRIPTIDEPGAKIQPFGAPNLRGDVSLYIRLGSKNSVRPDIDSYI